MNLKLKVTILDMPINKKIILYTMFLGSIKSYVTAQDTLIKARYLSLPYDLIDDKDATLTQTDYTLWKSELGEVKQIYFTSFDIEYTPNDSISTCKTLKKNSKNFADNFQDTALFYQNGGRTISLSSQISFPYFSKQIGSIITFISDKELYVSKIIGKKQIADSVRAKHILFRNISADKVEKVLNDLKNNKITWESANKLYNNDFVAAQNGGDLGYFTQGMMVETFDKLCFDIAKVGEYYRVETQFGEHIVQVSDKKFSGNSFSLQTMSYVSALELSEKTLKKIEDVAQKLIGKSKDIDELEKKLRKEGIELEEYTALSFPIREIIEWSNKAKNGEITKKPIKIHDPFTQKDKLMILGLRISNSNKLTDKELTKQYGYYMRRKKKSEILYQSVKELNSLEKIASKYNVEIQEIFLPNSEKRNSANEMISIDKIQNELYKYEANKLTEPIVGYNGIYIAYIFWKKY